jgi:hypothetical protein
MRERVGLEVRVDVLSYPEFLKKTYMPSLDKPPEEQDWDLAIRHHMDRHGHTAASFLTYDLLDESQIRWVKYDQVYEKMWKEMITTVDSQVPEERIRQMLK